MARFEIFWDDFIFRLDAYMQAGGEVMWPLAILSFIMFFLIVERALTIGRGFVRKPLPFAAAWDYVRRGRDPALDGHHGVVAALVGNFLAARGDDPELNARILRETAKEMSRALTDRLPFIGALAAVAPLLGLLGTVTGMIATFDVMAIFGAGNAKAMAGGISEALITTQTGLLVAIPGLCMKNFLEKRAKNLEKRLTAAGLYLTRKLAHEEKIGPQNPSSET
ncbi:MAG: MotA/TolQ/ExbB proton channel family protein [Desulfobulbaceae bacterium]|jgi:biopolymer transport protein ExbB|nr:MotA/TolQ/ExbB proton channel family protein [Desulfobulbaceae bacterium]